MTAPLTVTVCYFGLLAERRGLAEETLATTAQSPRTLYAELAAAHGLGMAASAFRVAVNEEFASWDQPLAGGDTVALLPPMSGG